MCLDRADRRSFPGPWWIAVLLATLTTPALAGEVDFTTQVRPLLSRKCLSCHGLDPVTRKAGLRLDRRDDATLELASGVAAIVPGDPDSSELIFRVSEPDPTVHMPPPDVGEPLTEQEIQLLTQWIQEGAVYQQHWAFISPVARPLPQVDDPSVVNPIDRWVRARLLSEGLDPAPPAEPGTLLRRLSLDLRGLPPTPDELDAFLNDHEPFAYERAVDRFLADPAYGERWAALWLDLARYADSAGYGSDPLRLNIWPYRDWVIHAFNRNMPLDQFTIEQIAGDLLPEATTQQKLATAFHRNTMTNTEGGTDDEEFRVAAVKDRVNTTGQVWMGLTFGCAQCHTHKYDPLAQQEYYQLFAVFNQTADSDRADEAPTLPLTDPPIARPVPPSEIQEQPAPATSPETTGDATKQGKAQEPEEKPLDVPVMQELPADKRRESHLLNKGNFLDPGPLVEPALPSAFNPAPPNQPIDRLALAHWLVDPANPLTARVAVNRVWEQLFGLGIVETQEDFGTQGELPTHPELLDWLALQYMRTGWDTKALIGLIVTSQTYRQSASATPELLERDPRNRLLARAPRVRLDAQMVRDQALALSGLLDRTIGGPSVFPPQPEGLWQAAFNGQRTWTESTGGDRHRRGLYVFWRRTVPYPSMASFDAPSRELCTVRRSRTNTPLQAFVTLNDPVYVEAAQALGRRLIAEGGANPTDRARYGLTLCLSRPPSEAQLDALIALYNEARTHFEAHPEEAQKLATQPLGPLPPSLDPIEAAVWTTIGNVLLNLDGVLTKG